MAAGLEQIVNDLAINIPLSADSQKSLTPNSHNIVINGTNAAHTMILVDRALDKAFMNKSISDLSIAKTTSWDGEDVKLLIWDISANYALIRYSNSPGYYKTSIANVFVYSVNDPSSFAKMKHTLEDVQKRSSNHAITFIVAHDPINPYIPRQSCEEGKIFSEKNNLNFIPVHMDPSSCKMLLSYIATEIRRRLKFNLELNFKMHNLLSEISAGDSSMISDADKIMLLRKKLLAFMAAYYYQVDKTIIDSIYKALQNLASLAPINEDDPITLCTIDPDNKITVSTGHQFDIALLIEYHNSRSYQGSTLGEQHTSRWLLNPLTGTMFSLEDSHYIQQQAAKRNLQIMYLKEEIKLPEEQAYIPAFFPPGQQLSNALQYNHHEVTNSHSLG